MPVPCLPYARGRGGREGAPASMTTKAQQSPNEELGPIAGVRDIIAVASTKGGVGKSTVAVNLALAMQRHGRTVGLLDADVYGPSLPLMLGVSGRPRMADDKRIFPLEKYGLRVMSLGFFLDDSSPVIWRGPMVMGLVRQFLKDVEWGTLDILVIDLPPGTGDTQLTLVQQVPLAGAVIVTTPQAVALLDVQRGIAMFEQVNTPVLGVVENMSYYHCPKCGRNDELFGAGGGARIAQSFGVPLLGQLPLQPAIRASGDAGTPIVAAEPQGEAAIIFGSIAGRVLDAIEAARGETAAPRIVG
ncbi:MAG: Mrp/NBP35 family ATP-binding protein [Deltaproteobacteria bacterium]|nr:Mrp/NBP35 family ATP-binding protein [Deltaproteobacteria bacterium]